MTTPQPIPPTFADELESIPTWNDIIEDRLTELENQRTLPELRELVDNLAGHTGQHAADVQRLDVRLQQLHYYGQLDHEAQTKRIRFLSLSVLVLSVVVLFISAVTGLLLWRLS